MTNIKYNNINESQSDVTSVEIDISDIMNFVEKARQAQSIIHSYTQEEVDELVTSIAWNVIKSKEELARLANERGGELAPLDWGPQKARSV